MPLPRARCLQRLHIGRERGKRRLILRVQAVGRGQLLGAPHDGHRVLYRTQEVFIGQMLQLLPPSPVRYVLDEDRRVHVERGGEPLKRVEVDAAGRAGFDVADGRTPDARPLGEHGRREASRLETATISYQETSGQVGGSSGGRIVLWQVCVPLSRVAPVTYSVIAHS